MVRTYKRKSGSRSYQTAYSEDTLKAAICGVKSGTTSILAASKRHKIPYGTLYKKSKPGYIHTTHGCPRVLSAAEEDNIVKVINHLTEWKFPLCEYDIRVIVQNFLNKQGRITSFVDNLPCYDWIKCFTKRHNLTRRIADNVKPSRSDIGHHDINRYFDNLSVAIDGVEPCNIFNYDETNMVDDLGVKHCILQRGLQRVERNISHSKQAISVMFCGNALGKFLPPMIVYKSKNLYEQWTQNGPDGTIYNHSESGWFDERLFEEWFFSMFLENAKDMLGKKVLMGDNLASHFSQSVIDYC